MRNKTRTILFLVAGLILLAGMVTSIAAAREGVWKTDGANQVAAPRLGAFINIWLETNVDNLEPAIAYNSNHDEYLVVWSNTRSGGATKDIYAQRVRGDGTLLSNFTIVHNASFHNYEPDVAYSPAQDEYLVVYTYDSVITDSDIWARRVKWDGSWMGSEFAIGRKTNKQHHPAVAYNSDADEYLVVYQNTWGGGGQDVDAERVRASDGTALGWVNIAAGAGYRSFPDVAYCPASNYYLIAYTFQPSSVTDPGDIYGKVASWNIGYLSSEIHICDDINDQGTVAVAGSAEEYLAVWEDSPSGSTTEMYARRLSADGTPQGPGGGFWITGSPGRYDEAPSVAHGSGYGYLIAWQRFISPGNYDVYGRYAMPGRDSGAGGEFALDNDVAAQMYPAVACATNGDCLMAEEDSNSAGGDFEIRGRLVWPYHVFLPLTLRNHQ
ncbi:MAG: hypothetical protein SWK90_07590 [Chloroflexota bacterium]|nr:hypothetical protein [Chloroflexota bacterium]